MLPPTPTDVIRCTVSAEAFRVATLFQAGSGTFRFRGSAGYPIGETANFVIISSTRTRARSLNTLKRVAEFTDDFHRAATERGQVFPTYGLESFRAIALWLQTLVRSGATIPHFGRYSMRVFVDALGLRSPWNALKSEGPRPPPGGGRWKPPPPSRPCS